MSGPRLHAIFHRQVRGDLALLRLAQQRFRPAGLGAEVYPGSPDELASELRFNPQPAGTFTIHLPRHFRVLDDGCHESVVAFARRCPPQALGLVLHDQPEVASRFDEYVAAARRLDQRLCQAGAGPWLFIEYAAGLEPEPFVKLFEALADCERISCCVDISHVGIRQVQRAFAASVGGDVCRLKPNHPDLPANVTAVQAACRTALPVVCAIIRAVGRLGKPLHFHLHDGHPSSPFSIFGVSDHLSFFQEVPIPFAYQGRRSLPPLYGPLGLKEIVDTARAALRDDQLSFTLEIHAPQDGRLDLGEHGLLFHGWKDRTNAERMNHWIEVLLRNHDLLRRLCRVEPAVEVRTPNPTPTPLFICFANCCRSVLAQHLYEHLFPGHTALGAGLVPGEQINGNALGMLGHWGRDASCHRPTALDRTLCQRADAIFVMGPVYLRSVLADHGIDLAEKTYLFADPFALPQSFEKGRFLVHDPSFDTGSAAELARASGWIHDRLRQIHEALNGRGERPLVPAARYLGLLERFVEG